MRSLYRRNNDQHLTCHLHDLYQKNRLMLSKNAFFSIKVQLARIFNCSNKAATGSPCLRPRYSSDPVKSEGGLRKRMTALVAIYQKPNIYHFCIHLVLIHQSEVIIIVTSGTFYLLGPKDEK